MRHSAKLGSTCVRTWWAWIVSSMLIFLQSWRLITGYLRHLRMVACYLFLKLSMLYILILQGSLHLLDHPSQLNDHLTVINGSKNMINNIAFFLLDMPDRWFSGSFRSDGYHAWLNELWFLFPTDRAKLLMHRAQLYGDGLVCSRSVRSTESIDRTKSN